MKAMKRVSTAQTRANILAALSWLGIQHAIIFSEDIVDNMDRSRVKAVDPNGLLLMAIKANVGPKAKQWSQDAGQNHNKNGIKIRASYRSRTTPSVQVCVIEAKGGQYDYCLEIDLDKYSPFVNMGGHIVELVENAGDRTTDPLAVRAMLKKHLGVDVPEAA